MYVNAEQIKEALIDIANDAGRPAYDLCVVRDVKNAIMQNTEHHLKVPVLDKIRGQIQDLNNELESNQTLRLKRLRSLCVSDQMKTQLGDESGLGVKFINNLVRGRYEISDSTWSRLEDSLLRFELNDKT